MTAWPLDLHVTAINYTNDALKTSHMMKDSWTTPLVALCVPGDEGLNQGTEKLLPGLYGVTSLTHQKGILIWCVSE